MIRVRFLRADGTVRDVLATPGQRLLDAAQSVGEPLEGTCGGELACGTCHVRVTPEWLDRLPPPSAEEEDLLDLLPDAGRTSRLSCQLVLTPALDGLEARAA